MTKLIKEVTVAGDTDYEGYATQITALLTDEDEALVRKVATAISQLDEEDKWGNWPTDYHATKTFAQLYKGTLSMADVDTFNQQFMPNSIGEYDVHSIKTITIKEVVSIEELIV